MECGRSRISARPGGGVNPEPRRHRDQGRRRPVGLTLTRLGRVLVHGDRVRHAESDVHGWRNTCDPGRHRYMARRKPCLNNSSGVLSRLSHKPGPPLLRLDQAAIRSGVLRNRFGAMLSAMSLRIIHTPLSGGHRKQRVAEIELAHGEGRKSRWCRMQVDRRMGGEVWRGSRTRYAANHRASIS